MLALLDHREASDTYRGELFREGNLRVIVCKDGIQWMLQRFKCAEGRAGGRWLAVGYCLTRKGLMRLCPDSHALLRVKVEELPDSFRRDAARP